MGGRYLLQQAAPKHHVWSRNPHTALRQSLLADRNPEAARWAYAGAPGTSGRALWAPAQANLSVPSPDLDPAGRLDPTRPQLPPGCPHLPRSSGPGAVLGARGGDRSPLTWSSACLQAAGPQGPRSQRGPKPATRSHRATWKPPPATSTALPATRERGEDSSRPVRSGLRLQKGDQLWSSVTAGNCSRELEGSLTSQAYRSRKAPRYRVWLFGLASLEWGRGLSCLCPPGWFNRFRCGTLETAELKVI